MVLAFTTVSAVLGASTLRGLASLFLGLFLGLIGIDTQTGQARFALGIPELLDGIDVVVVAVGLFAVGETLYVASLLNARRRDDRADQGLGLDERGGLGALVEAVAARHRDRLSVRHDAGGRRGDPDVPVVRDREASSRSIPKSSARARSKAWPGPEAANNASATGALVPLLTLGLPTSATAAIILAGVPAVRPAAGAAAVRDAAARSCGR